MTILAAIQPAAAQRPTAAEIVAFCEARLAEAAAEAESVSAAADATMTGACTVASPMPASSVAASPRANVGGVFSPVAHAAAPAATVATVTKSGSGSGNAQFGAQTLRFAESPAAAMTPSARSGGDANFNLNGAIQFLSPGAGHHSQHPQNSRHTPFHATPAPGFTTMGLTPSPGHPTVHSGGDHTPSPMTAVGRLSHPTSAAELAMAQEIAALRASLAAQREETRRLTEILAPVF